jgi:two-component system, OmpR family, osmolarity sensor histidine kinase EnvZ
MPRLITIRLKKILPKSLFGRSIVILLTPLLIVQIVLGYIFFDRHTESILKNTAKNIAGDIALVVFLVENQKNYDQIISNAVYKLDLKVKIGKLKPLQKIGAYKETWLYKFLSEAIDEKLKKPYFLRMNSDFIFVDVQTKKHLVSFQASRKRFFSRTTPLVLIWTTASALLLFIVASIFMINQIKPLRRLAQAADRFGKNEDISDDFKVGGAREIRQTGIAFNLMKNRIKKHLQDRLEMLSKVSHDLRTPITRLKLQLALMKKSPETESLNNDVDLMQAIIEEFLSYARGTVDEDYIEINLKDFIDQVIQYINLIHKNEKKITLNCPQNLFIKIKKHIFNRCLTNLLLNSSKYARNIWITCTKNMKSCQIIIDDDGPGIPEKDRELVFQPFYRLDQARNLDKGGVGLGLAMVRDAIRSHGGQIHLKSVPDKTGLRVLLVLPM